MPPVASIFATNKTAIEERLSRTIEQFWQGMDPVVRDTQVSSEEVVSSGPDNRDFNVHLLFQNILAGVIEPMQVRDDVSLYGDGLDSSFGSKIVRRGLSGTVPDPFEGPNPVPYRLTVPMRGFDVNLGLTMAEMRLEATKAAIAKIIAPKMKGFAVNTARRMCAYWHMDQGQSYRLSSLGPSTGDGAYSISSPSLTFYPPEECTHRYHVGDAVDIVRDATGSAAATQAVRVNDSQAPASWASNANVDTAAGAQTTATRARMFVSAVDPLENRVVLTAAATTAGNAALTITDWMNTSDIAELAYVVYANSTVGAFQAAGTAALFQGPAGWNSWIKTGRGGSDDYLMGAERVNDSTLGGEINVRTHPEFRSFYKAVNGVLTEHNLGLYLDRFQEAKEDLGQYLDTIVTTRGIMRAFQAERIDRERIDRTGRLPSLTSVGAPNEWDYTHNGRKYRIYTSKWINQGELIGYRRGGGNWKRFVPPRPAGVKRMNGQQEAFVPLDLIAPLLTGTSSTILPMRNADARPLYGVEMPGMMHYQLCPVEQAAGLKLAGLTEDRVYTDAS